MIFLFKTGCVLEILIGPRGIKNQENRQSGQIQTEPQVTRRRLAGKVLKKGRNGVRGSLAMGEKGDENKSGPKASKRKRNGVKKKNETSGERIILLAVGASGPAEREE